MSERSSSREPEGSRLPEPATVTAPGVFERRAARPWEAVLAGIPAAMEAAHVDRLAEVDLSSWLAAAGRPLPFRIHVTEFCRATCAARALCLRPSLAYVTPCRLVVRESDEGVVVGVLLPSAAATLVLRPDDDALSRLSPLVSVMDRVAERLVRDLAGEREGGQV